MTKMFYGPHEFQILATKQCLRTNICIYKVAWKCREAGGERASLVAQLLKSLPATQEILVQFLSLKDLLKKG